MTELRSQLICNKSYFVPKPVVCHIMFNFSCLMQLERFLQLNCVHRKWKGSPVMTRAITDGWASAAGDTLLASTRDGGRGELIPCCAGVITALASILLFIPVAGPGANHTTLFSPSLQITRFPLCQSISVSTSSLNNNRKEIIWL